MIVEQPVAGEAVNAVKFEFLIESGPGHHPLERGDAHVWHILEAHMKSHGGDHRVDDLIGEAKTLEQSESHPRTDSLMAIEADSPRLIDHAGRWFPDVMEQYRKHQRKRSIRLQHGKHEAGMDKDIPLGMKLGWLVAPLE